MGAIERMDVASWLCELGLDRFVGAFREAEIDGRALLALTDGDLTEMGLPIGPRRVVLDARLALARGPSDGRGRPASAAERRQISVVFVDLVGSTPLAARLDPEDMREVVRAFQNAVSGEVARFGGHVAKFLGDGALCYFGWPRAHEDAAERAVRATFAMLDAVPRLTTPDGASLAIRVGIATGLVVVGELLGESGVQEETVVGETPNLAARLQEVAVPGTVLVCDATRQLMGSVFTVYAREGLRLKGFTQPMRAFDVVGERIGVSRFEARRSGDLLPMLGRDQELAIVLRHWRQVLAGEGQAVILIGEAGIGKSRLVEAFFESVRPERPWRLRFQCSPLRTATPLWPIAERLRRAARFGREASEDARLARLAALLAASTSDRPLSVALLGVLLGIGAGSPSPLSALTPQQQRMRTLEVLNDQILAMARRRPVVVVVEDVHWIDPSTLELIGHVLDRLAGTRILVLVTTRAGEPDGLGAHPRASRLTLDRLQRVATEALIAQVSRGTPMPTDLVTEIAARAEGVPFFAEELTKATLEAGPRFQGVPTSLTASLMARIDRAPAVKETAQLAACIGRDFAYAPLASLWPGAEADLRAALGQLIEAELVHVRGTPPESTYMFKHALVRDAAYESLLKARRRELHGQIAALLEARFPETAAAAPEVLARHYSEAGNLSRAAALWSEAAEHALARSALAESVVHANQGLEAVMALADTGERRRLELALQLALGQASIAAKGFAADETRRAYTRARELCAEVGDLPEVFPALYGAFIVQFQGRELTTALQTARDLLRFAEQRGHRRARVTGHRIIGSALYHLGRFAEARQHCEACLALYEVDEDRRSALVYALDSKVVADFWLIHTLHALGFADDAAAGVAAGLDYARELAHPYSLAYAQAVAALFHAREPLSEASLAEAERLAAGASAQPFPLPAAVGIAVQAWVAAVGHGRSEGVERVRSGVSAYRATGAELWAPALLLLQAEAAGAAGLPERGLDGVDEALRSAEATGGAWLTAELLRVRATLLANCGDVLGAGAALELALGIARRQGARLFELRAATDLVRLSGPGRTSADHRARLVGLLHDVPPIVAAADVLVARRVLAAS